MQKFSKRLCVILLVALLVLLASGCSGTDEWETMQNAAAKLGNTVEDAQLRQDTQQMLNCLLADDFDGAYALVAAVASQEEFLQVYPDMRAVLPGVSTYELIASYKNASVRNGITMISVRYMLSSGEKRAIVEATRQDGASGLIGFSIYEYVPVTQTGTWGTMQGANAFQWIVMTIGLLMIGLMVYAFVDCCRNKVRRKWLWLLVIALGVMATSIHLGNGFRIQYNIGSVFNLYSALVMYSSGGTTLRLMVPVGALAYAICKKKLLVQPEPSATPEEPMELEQVQQEPSSEA